ITDYGLQNLFFYLTAGALIGGRLGYVLFYSFPYYLNNPLEIFFPIKITDYGLLFTGYYGLSYFGGLVGAVLAGYFFSRKRRINFWQLADFVALAIPMGYFFGRIGNFLNGELYGRPTNMFWGMNFGDGLLRHPSQLYEAFFEGLVLFGIIFLVRRLVRTNL
ncbi:MAG TPA: prolipoprotein diacylglyceryl transferase, partial [Candidatus Moranbacteria bacterium]|nr:prolipoprotein diacylglyceryl transferase [Candidatus Moranbacteria bacterium]